jgi:uncharacterized OsmC-like protein
MGQAEIKKSIVELCDTFKKRPEGAKAVFRAQTEWIKNLQCSARIRNFPPFTLDEPPKIGGEDAGCNPVELLLAALGTCQEIVYAAYAAVLDIPLDSVKINVKGYLDLQGLLSLDDTVPPGYKDIQFETIIESPADEETILKLAKIVETHCPVLDTLSRKIPVQGKVSINGGALVPIS